MHKDQYIKDEILNSEHRISKRSLTSSKGFTPIKLTSLKAERTIHHIRTNKAKQQLNQTVNHLESISNLAPWESLELDTISKLLSNYKKEISTHRHSLSELPNEFRDDSSDIDQDTSEYRTDLDIPRSFATRNSIFQVENIRDLTATPIKPFSCTRPSNK